MSRFSDLLSLAMRNLTPYFSLLTVNFSVTLTFRLDQISVRVNRHAKYLVIAIHKNAENPRIQHRHALDRVLYLDY